MLDFRVVAEEIWKKWRVNKAYHNKSASVEQRPLNISTYSKELSPTKTCCTPSWLSAQGRSQQKKSTEHFQETTDGSQWVNAIIQPSHHQSLKGSP